MELRLMCEDCIPMIHRLGTATGRSEELVISDLYNFTAYPFNSLEDSERQAWDFYRQIAMAAGAA